MANVLNHSKLFFKKNASTILTCMGGVGVVVTAVTAVKATPKALMLLEEAKKEKGEELTKIETVKVAWKPYIPAILMGTATISCVFGAQILNKRTQAALTSAYTLLSASYNEYKDKVEELYGKTAVEEINTELAKDKYEEQKPEVEDDGKHLFYDEYSKRYFRATNEAVLRAEYMINKEVSDNFYATVNEFYRLVGADPIEGGDAVGWSSSQMYDMYWSDWVDFWHEKVELEDGMECFMICMTEPLPGFEDY